MYKPARGRVIIRRADALEISEGGILIPTVAQEADLIGEVVAVGSGELTRKGKVIEPEMQVGDKVRFGRLLGAEIEWDGVDLLVLNQHDILSVEE